MEFKGIDNQSVKLIVTNYEFPNTKDREYDGNWLVIYLKVKSNLGNWQTSDSSLLTWELENIISWLKELSQNQQPKRSVLEFIEPNLSFTLKNKATDKLKSISIHFDLESRPQSAKDDVDYYVECLLNNEELMQTATELSDELAKYPIRK